MPYYHLKRYNNSFKRKCECGGNPQMILDIAQDYIVRCEKCHESTNAYMRNEEAIKAWENSECTGPLDLLTDDLEKNLQNIKFLFIAQEGFWQVNSQSCDCLELIVDTGEKLISVEHNEYMEDGCIEFDEISSFNKEAYKYQVNLSNGTFKLDKIKYYENDFVEAIRYKCEDAFLFVFASEDNLIITMSKYDLFEEIQMDFPEIEATLEIKES